MQYPPLNLPLTKTPEFLAKIQSILNEYYPCTHQQKPHGFTETTTTLTPPETPKSSEKPKAINFPVSKITIGQWTHTAVYPDDLKAKFYFAKRKLMWEILDNVQTGTQVARLKRKIEIQWVDVLSLRKTFHSHDETGTLEVELGKRPTFFVETNPQAGKHTQWKQMDQDFTLDQSASKCRRHTLHFAAGVLQKNFEKIMSSHSFWSKLSMVTFPVLPPYFDIGYGNNNNNSSLYGQCQTFSSNVNNDHLQYNPQGLGHVPDHGEVNFKMATPFCANDGRQINSFVHENRQNETMNQLPGTQVRQPSSQLNNMGSYFSGSQYSNPMSQMINTGDFRGLDTRADYSMVNQHMNQVPSIHRVGPYPQGYFVRGDPQNMEHTRMDGSIQTNNICGCGQHFSNDECSMPPDS
ncbi:unnamed protein product [Microthlaspi erraticum]|uniref:TRF2/HOY1 PH-like domain-containing protein n=1 Tax=Microthlaspi erraticum TaxID=1685480 RepID=A0A6D2HJ33_9BRAS|nr:unnamed protein product [Microthlaspi erraticum]